MTQRLSWLFFFTLCLFSWVSCLNSPESQPNKDDDPTNTSQHHSEQQTKGIEEPIVDEFMDAGTLSEKEDSIIDALPNTQDSDPALDGCKKITRIENIQLQGDPSTLYQSAYSSFSPELGTVAKESPAGSDIWINADYITVEFRIGGDHKQGSFALGKEEFSNFQYAPQRVYIDIDFQGTTLLGKRVFFASSGKLVIQELLLDSFDGWVISTKGFLQDVVLKEITLDDEDRSTFLDNGECILVKGPYPWNYTSTEEEQ